MALCSRPRVPEEADGAERSGPEAEPGGHHVQPARIPAQPQVRLRQVLGCCSGAEPPCVGSGGLEGH